MDIPNFQDFLQWITPEKISSIMEQNYLPYIHQIKFDLHDKESIAQIPQQILNEAVTQASRVSFAQIQAYHEWLKEQISQYPSSSQK